MGKLICIFVSFLLLTNLSCGQSKPLTQTNQIGFINTTLFYDERVGIIPLVLAVKKLDTEFAPQMNELKELTEKYRKLTGELEKLSSRIFDYKISDEMIKNKISEVETLNRQINNKTEELKTSFEKRKQESTKDLRADIAKTLEIFASENNYRLILGESRDFVSDDAIDATSDFVKFYHKRPKTQ